MREQSFTVDPNSFDPLSEIVPLFSFSSIMRPINRSGVGGQAIEITVTFAERKESGIDPCVTRVTNHLKQVQVSSVRNDNGRFQGAVNNITSMQQIMAIIRWEMNAECLLCRSHLCFGGQTQGMRNGDVQPAKRLNCGD